MGGIDPNIILRLQTPQIPRPQIATPLEQYSKILSLGALMQQGQLRSLELQQAQLAMDRTAAINRELQGLPPVGTSVPPQIAPAGTEASVSGGRYYEPNLMRPAGPEDRPTAVPLPAAPTLAPTASPLPAAPQISGVPENAFWLRTTPPAPAATAPVPTAAPLSAATAPAVTGGMPTFAGFPTTERLLKVGGIAALPVIENLNKARKAQLDAHISQLTADKSETAARADLATGAIDNNSLKRNLATAANKGYITWDQARQYSDLGFDHPATQAWLKSAQLQAVGADKAQEMRIRDAKESRDQLLFGPQLTEATSKAVTAQQEGDAKLLAAAARQGPDSLKRVMDQIGPNRAAPFQGLTTPDDLMAMGQKAHEYVTAAESKRHNLSQEEMAGVNSAISAGRLRETRRVNEIEYGPGQSQYWVQQIYENPDSINMVPEKLRGTVGQAFTQRYGLPLPKPLSESAKTTETAARNALDGVDFIRKAIQDPEVRQRIGPLMGRLGEAEQDAGTTVGMSPQAARLAQELRTRMRYFVFQEGKAIMGGRMPESLMHALEQSSGNVKMNADMLEGALRGAEGAAKDTLENADRQRFGGKARPPEARGLQPTSVSPEVRTLLSDPKVTPGIHTLSNGTKFMKAADGTITPAQ